MMKNTALATAIGVLMMLPAFGGHAAFARSSAWGDIVGEHDAPSVAAPVGAPKTPAHAVSLDDALRGLARDFQFIRINPVPEPRFRDVYQSSEVQGSSG